MLGGGSRAGGDSRYVERCRVEGGARGGEGGRVIAEVQLVHEGSHRFLCQRALGRHTASEGEGGKALVHFRKQATQLPNTLLIDRPESPIGTT